LGQMFFVFDGVIDLVPAVLWRRIESPLSTSR
jgi:hypothetical protein